MTVERVGAGAPQHLGPGQPLQAAEAPLNWYVSSRTFRITDFAQTNKSHISSYDEGIYSLHFENRQVSGPIPRLQFIKTEKLGQNSKKYSFWLLENLNSEL